MTQKMRHSPNFAASWLIAAHLLLCLSQLPGHAARYPVAQSLFFWWITPLDLFSLCAVTVLYLKAARWGFCLNGLFSGVQALALIYFSIKTAALPITLQSISALSLFDAAGVLARIPIGWVIAATVQPWQPLARGCEP